MDHKFKIGQYVRVRNDADTCGYDGLVGNVFKIREISPLREYIFLDTPDDKLSIFFPQEIEALEHVEGNHLDDTSVTYQIVGQRHGEEEVLSETKELQNAMDLVIAANLGLSIPHSALKYYGFYHRKKVNPDGT